MRRGIKSNPLQTNLGNINWTQFPANVNKIRCEKLNLRPENIGLVEPISIT
ncbi:MAG: hypothetical protein IPI31_16210 [Bacteroidetes bacterium]|jgi:hypothetical protein|nr:hypothetical protein [Bacteroidota bacterium]